MPFNEPTVLPDDIKRSGDSRWPRRDEVWHAVQVYRSANLTITNNITTTVDWDSEHFDTSNIHDNATNNTRLTAPTDGIYMIYHNLRWGGAVGVPEATIRLNGSSSIAATRFGWSSSSDFNLVGIFGRHLNKGDYVELQVLHSSAGDRDLIGGATRSVFGMYRIG